MRQLTLADLPAPPAGRRGWPWTEAPGPLPATGPGGAPWPALAVVTPSMNQVRYLEAAIRSVLLQGYPALEYVIMDGGSTDGSREVIERYAPYLTAWTSEPDAGQYDAITRGHDRTTGRLMAWLNSDDLYLPGAFRTVAEAFSELAPVEPLEWLTTLRPYRIEGDGAPRPARALPGFSRAAFRRGEYVIGIRPVWSGWIPQESTFWTRDLWSRTGGRLRADLDLAADFELWARFAAEAELYGIDAPLAAFRLQPEQKTAVALDRYRREARQVLAERGGRPNGYLRAALRMLISRSPLPVRRLAALVGLSPRAPVVVRQGPGWVVRRDRV